MVAKTRKKKKKSKVLNWVFLAVLILIVAGVGIYSYRQSKKETRWKLAEYQSTESTYMGDLQISILASATLQPFEIVDVRPEASGQILELYFDVGDWVEEGQPMALLDQEDLANRVETARADVSRAQANLDLVRRGYTPRELQSYESQVDTARLALNEAMEDLDHATELHEAGFASDEELDTAEYAVEQNRLHLEQTEAALAILLEGSTSEEIRSAQASMQVARINLQDSENALGDATIYSPMSGVVLERYVTEGSVVVSSLASFSGGDSMCTIGDLSSMKAYANVDENDIGYVVEEQRCILDVDAYPDEDFEGYVLKIHPQATNQGGSTIFMAEIEVPNVDGRLMAGMSCEVEIITEAIEDILLVPDRAIAVREGVNWVFVVDEDENIEARRIETGKTNYEFTEVLEGLELGEEVIVRGVPRDLLDEVAGDEDEDGGVEVRVE